MKHGVYELSFCNELEKISGKVSDIPVGLRPFAGYLREIPDRPTVYTPKLDGFIEYGTDGGERSLVSKPGDNKMFTYDIETGKMKPAGTKEQLKKHYAAMLWGTDR